MNQLFHMVLKNRKSSILFRTDEISLINSRPDNSISHKTHSGNIPCRPIAKYGMNHNSDIHFALFTGKRILVRIHNPDKIILKHGAYYHTLLF